MGVTKSCTVSERELGQRCKTRNTHGKPTKLHSDVLVRIFSPQFVVLLAVTHHGKHHICEQQLMRNGRTVTLNQPRTHKCVQSLHKSIRIYMGVIILGANTLYINLF